MHKKRGRAVNKGIKEVSGLTLAVFDVRSMYVSASVSCTNMYSVCKLLICWFSCKRPHSAGPVGEIKVFKNEVCKEDNMLVLAICLCNTRTYL
jgi:hypothetical protein